MKQIIRLCAIFLFLNIFVGATAQEYWIEGFYERHEEGNYTLKDVHTQGITIDGKTDFPGTIFRGNKVQLSNCRNGLAATMVKFSFDKVKTDCKTWRDLRFEYWDEDNERDSIKWKEDVEACMGETKDFSKKKVVMMLVLDYSSSMDNTKELKKGQLPNIERMKNMAIKFINAMSVVSDGNLCVGIVAFAGMDRAQNQIFPITPLTQNNRSQFEAFIKKSTMGTETAMYFSIDNAMKKMKEYIENQHFTKDNYNGTFMITFTDGMDNASINDKVSKRMQRGSKNEYLAYLSPLFQWEGGEKILATPIEHYVAGFTGSEDFTTDDERLFKSVLQKLTPDDNHFKLSKNFDEVEMFFEDIASNLTLRWKTLNVYIGEAQYGRVRWVLDCEPEQQPKEPKPKPDFMRLPLFGLNVGLGGGFSKPTKFLEFSVGLDFAVACNAKFAMGLYGSYKTSFKSFHQYALGFDFLIGPQQKAFLLGLGINRRLRGKVKFYEDNYYVTRWTDDAVDFDMRLGGVFKGFYFFADFSIGRYGWEDYIALGSYEGVQYKTCYDHRVLPQLTLNLGINFMQLGRKNKTNKKN